MKRGGQGRLKMGAEQADQQLKRKHDHTKEVLLEGRDVNSSVYLKLD